MKFIIELIVALLKAFFPAIKDGLKDTYTVAVPEDDGLKKRLRDKVNATWGTSLALLCLCLCLVGCGTKTVYIPDGTPVKLREALEGVKVWIKDQDGNTIATVMDIPEGWYILPDSQD